MRLFTDPAHVTLPAIVVAIALGFYLVNRRRRNAGPRLDHLDDDHHQHRLLADAGVGELARRGQSLETAYLELTTAEGS